jgi:hypothetical protein
MNTSKVEMYRVMSGVMASNKHNQFGAFIIPTKNKHLQVICAPCSDEWQHVSVSMKDQTPSWEDMCMVKNLFWDEEDTVVQFHPPKSEYVNNHQHCLHLWKKKEGSFPTPPSILVGLKGKELPEKVDSKP